MYKNYKPNFYSIQQENTVDTDSNKTADLVRTMLL